MPYKRDVGRRKWNKSEEWRIIAFDDNRSREIDPLPVQLNPSTIECALNVVDLRPRALLTISRRIVSLKETTRDDEFVEVAIDHSGIQISAGGHTPPRLSILHLNQVIPVVACT